MTPEKICKLIPVQGMATCPTIEPIFPDATDRPIELQKTPEIRRAPVVLVVTLQFPIESLLLLLNRIMPMLLAPGRYIQKTAPETLPHRSYVDRKLPLPASFADMRESKKVESRRLLPARLLRLRQGLSPERHQSCLVRMELQTVLRKSLGQHIHDPLRILPILKAQNEVVRISNFVSFALQPGLHHSLEPFVENVVKIYIGQQRANHLPLTSPRF